MASNTIEYCVIVFQYCGDFWYSSGNVVETDPSHTVLKSASLPGTLSYAQLLFQGFPDHI